jgi:hypothetical protein
VLNFAETEQIVHLNALSVNFYKLENYPLKKLLVNVRSSV